MERKMLLLITMFILLLSQEPYITFQQELNPIQPILRDCHPEAGNYTANSAFETNLVHILLPSLATQALLHNSTFYNLTVGEGTDRIFGFAQCMSGSTQQECSDSLIMSVFQILEVCSNSRQAMVRYYNCILHYSDQPFVSQLDTSLDFIIGPVAIASEPAVFNRQVGVLMRSLFNQSSVLPSRIAVGTINYTSLIDIYGLAQCTRDLSSSDCYICLNQTMNQISSCCMNRQGGNVYYPSCNIRYEIYAFRPVEDPPPPASITQTSNGNDRSGRRRITIIGVAIAIALALLILLCSLWLARRRFLKRLAGLKREEREEDEKQLLFDLNEIKVATNNFSLGNKLGQGGFGPVYKGELSDGQEIAVKRLFSGSNQGMVELRNEVALLAKLQHRNLVKLLGCCLEEGENLLVYEFVPNTSLEKFLFDPVKSGLLIWKQRFKIVVGIARGLLYLHEDSRLRIIHRDLKASNILLDLEMNPKISDFGVAIIFDADQTRGSTNRIAGTFGYMAPEYVMHGRFSMKSDVFSFGVLILEIATGRKNSGFEQSGDAIDLLSLVWRHWREGTISSRLDKNMGEYPSNEVIRCIHIGLLCVQEDPMERPLMSTIVLMLSSLSIILPNPLPPAFIIRRNDSSSSTTGSHHNNPLSVNEVSITYPYPR